jgi:predicted phosphoribosyltransferase
LHFEGNRTIRMVMFASRDDAGLKLGRCLQEQGVRADLVLGLPRGGVVVAAGVARTYCACRWTCSLFARSGIPGSVNLPSARWRSTA